jgi:ubiquinone/menaquinone biosynthesis C-methylase UbiE
MTQNIEQLANSFNNVAENYDDITDTFAHKIFEYVNQKNVELFLNNHKINKLLDAGGGTGKWSLFLYDYCRDITLLDISSKSLQIAKNKLNNTSIKIIEGNVEKTVFNNNDFDFIFAEGGVISYTPDYDKMLKEINRILKINGFCWIDFYNSLGWAAENENIDFKLNVALTDEKLIKMDGWDYPVRIFLPKYLENKIIENGFKIINFFANNILLNTIKLKEKYKSEYDMNKINKFREIELFLSRNANYYNTSTTCQFLIKKL